MSVPFAFKAEGAQHAGNADSLGSIRAGDYLLAGESSSITAEMITDGEITDDDIALGASIDPGKIAGTAWTSTNDGSASGLDADMVDGLNADAFADTGHDHNVIYFTKDESHMPGTLNDASDPIDWTKLKGVPAGFADGTDDGGSGVGDGHSLDASDGDPVDALYVDGEGDVGIGTASPGEKLQVGGTIHSTSGGFRFPDGTLQTTASETRHPTVFSWGIDKNRFAYLKNQESGYLYFCGADGAGTTMVMENATGEVGIGTASRATSSMSPVRLMHRVIPPRPMPGSGPM